MTQRKTATKKTATKKAPAKVKPLPISSSVPYIEIDCAKVGLTTSGDLIFNTSYQPLTEDDYESSEKFDQFMLTMYEMAKRQGIAIPEVPK